VIARPQQSGFVLVATLWFVAVLALAAAIMTGWVVRSLSGGSALAARLSARRQAITAVNDVAFVLATNYFSLRGLELLGGDDRAQAMALPQPHYTPQPGANPFIALDNRPYRIGRGIIRVQDTRGLYNLLAASRADFDDLLRSYGVPFEDRPALWDRLRDYVGFGLPDGDTPAYAAAGRPPPRLAPLLTPWETRRVLGWADEAGLWQGPDALPEIATVSNHVGFNPNTAPARLLRTLPGIDAAAVDRIIQYRDLHPMRSIVDFQAASEVVGAIDPMRAYFYPAGTLRLELDLPGEPATWVVALRKVGLGPAPCRIDYAYFRPRLVPLPAAAAIAALPALPGAEEEEGR
jgi:general secretion pathway protein K